MQPLGGAFSRASIVVTASIALWGGCSTNGAAARDAGAGGTGATGVGGTGVGAAGVGGSRAGGGGTGTAGTAGTATCATAGSTDGGVGSDGGQPPTIFDYILSDDNTCVFYDDGATMACWGDNGWGQLGDCTTVSRPTPGLIPGLPKLNGFAITQTKICAIAAGPTPLSGGPVYCWGPGPPTAVEGATNAASVSLSNDHGCAVVDEGHRVVCWGSNYYGQLGDGTKVSSAAAVDVVDLPDQAFVTAGPGYTCSMNLDNAAWCWGWNAHGELGDGTTTDRSRPVRLVTSDPIAWVQLAGTHVYAGTALQNLLCWGTGVCGDGGGLSSMRLSPTAVPLPGPLNGVPIGVNDSACVLLDGAVACWGRNIHGEVGDGTFNERFTATVAMTPAKSADFAGTSEGTSFYVIAEYGHVYAWGRNDHGQLGDGTTTDRNTPVRVLGVTAAWIKAGRAHACAKSSGGVLQCWGANEHGQLGDGTFVDRPTPITVHF